MSNRSKNRIIIIATLSLLDNKAEELKEVVEDLQSHCSETEDGMLQYDWYLSENSSTIKVLETYTNSEAVLYHFDNYKPFAERLSNYRSFISLEVYGAASDELRQRVKKINAEHFSLLSPLNKVS